MSDGTTEKARQINIPIPVGDEICTVASIIRGVLTTLIDPAKASISTKTRQKCEACHAGCEIGWPEHSDPLKRSGYINSRNRIRSHANSVTVARRADLLNPLYLSEGIVFRDEWIGLIIAGATRAWS